jgi:hypothetical protein
MERTAMGEAASGGGSGETELRETLAALEMPPAGLRRWLQANRRFCTRHGPHHYRELLALYARCLAILDERGR